MTKKEFLLQNKEAVKTMFIDENRTVVEVAEKFNCSTAVLQRFLREQGISKRKQLKLEDLPSKEELQNLIDKGVEYSEICKKYGIGNIYLRKILEIGKFSNKINEECLTEDNPILWYLLGIISSDGHNGRFNEVDIFQKDGTYLNNLKKLLNHEGTLYKSGEGYILRLNSPKLTEILNSKNVGSDKRYTVPYIKAPNKELESCFIRGLFDGDGCIYYNYTSGSFQNIRMEITTGSENMIQGLKQLYDELELHYTIDSRISGTGNKYYVIYVRTIKDTIKLGNWIYSNSFKFRLMQKYIKYLKFLGIIKMEREVDDIVDAY